MAECPACSKPTDDDASSCAHCGSALDDLSSLMTQSGMTGDLRQPGSNERPPSSSSRSGSSALGLLSSAQSQAGDYQAGTILAGRYRVVGLLGRGGMGEVFRADDLTLGQAVALKFLPAELAADMERLERFRSEVRVSRQVSHPNVCRVHDIGESDGKVFLSMELVDGGDLSSLLKRVGHLPQDKGLEIARQLCAGLAAAHDRGVLHRDLKPANVMIDSEGRVRIADFGLAGIAGGIAAGEIFCGTPAYMAPEVFSGKEVTQRSDIYALGLVLYELFTGRRPFKGKTISELGEKHRNEPPPPPSEIVQGLDPEIERVLLQCLAKDPSERPSSALSVSAMLPGGDPLAAALAAGETPSPEQVAQAGEEGILSPLVAWALLFCAIISIVATAMLQGPRQVLEIAPLDRPPAVLLDRAREKLERLGVEVPTAELAFGFTSDTARVREIDRDGVSAEERRMISNGEVNTIKLWFRAAPRDLVTSNSTGRVSPTSPARRQPGEVFAWFDGGDRLAFLEVVPEERRVPSDTPSNVSHEPDWAKAFDATGLDATDFEPAEALWSPPQHVEVLRAWTRTSGGNDLDIARLEAGVRNGSIVYARTIPSFKEQASGGGPQATQSTITQTLNVLLVIAVLIGGASLARRNIRLGRGDLRGAWRLAAVICGLDLAQWLLSADHAVTANDEFVLFTISVSQALFMGGFVWLLYVALEPEVRRYWPERLISWQRLLVQRYRDPLVARHILIGVVIGSGMAAFVGLTSFVLWIQDGIRSSLATSGIRLIKGAGRAFSGQIAGLEQSIFTGVFITVLLLLARLVLRRTWAAVILTMVVFIGLNSLATEDWLINGSIMLVLFSAIMAALLRYGLLTLVVTVFSANLLLNSPLSLSLSKWYLSASLAPMLILGGLAYLSFTIAQGSKQRVDPG